MSKLKAHRKTIFSGYVASGLFSSKQFHKVGARFSILLALLCGCDKGSMAGLADFQKPACASELGCMGEEELLVTHAPLSFDTHGGMQTVSIHLLGDWQIEPVSYAWMTAARTDASTLTVTVDTNYSGVAREGEIILQELAGNKKGAVPIAQAFDNALFLGATTEMGRRLVYNSDGLVSAVTADKQYALHERVLVLEISYNGDVNGENQPVSLFLADVTLEGGTTLRMTTAHDEDSSIKRTDAETTDIQTVREQLAAMQNKRSSQLDVLAGVNADFFEIGKSNLLRGVMYREGLCLKDTFVDTSRRVFALTKDGKAHILQQPQYNAMDKSHLWEAVSGFALLLSDGKMVAGHSKDIPPRTAVGVSREGNRVFLLVVDGALVNNKDKEEHSVGATYFMLAKMLLAMGAHEALNLDGGGSSTFAVKKSTDMPSTADSFETRNRPSGGAERAVANGIAIVQLKNEE